VPEVLELQDQVVMVHQVVHQYFQQLQVQEEEAVEVLLVVLEYQEVQEVEVLFHQVQVEQEILRQ